MTRKMFEKNLRFIRKKLKLTQEEFAKPLNIKGSSVSSMERGKSKPSNAVLELIEIKYQINRNWLMTGDGDPHKDKELQSTAFNQVGSVGADEFGIAVAGLKEIFDSRDPVLLPAIQANIRAFQISVRRERQIQQQQTEIDELKEECGDLRKRLAALEKHIKEKKDAPGRNPAGAGSFTENKKT